MQRGCRMLISKLLIANGGAMLGMCQIGSHHPGDDEEATCKRTCWTGSAQLGRVIPFTKFGLSSTLLTRLLIAKFG